MTMSELQVQQGQAAVVDPALRGESPFKVKKPTRRSSTSLHLIASPSSSKLIPILPHTPSTMQLRRHAQPSSSQPPTNSASNANTTPATAQPPSPEYSTHTPRVPAKGIKRARARPKHTQPREEVCGHCHGHDHQNARGKPEQMLTCSVCGRSVHPSCAQLEKMAETCRSYGWECFKCKVCSVCGKVTENDGNRMVFCDSCDRGWHQFCMTPPLAPLPRPDEEWFCPVCNGVPLSALPVAEGSRSGSEVEREVRGDAEQAEEDEDMDAEGEPDPAVVQLQEEDIEGDEDEDAEGEDDDEVMDEDYRPEMDGEGDAEEEEEGDDASYQPSEVRPRGGHARQRSGSRVRSRGSPSKTVYGGKGKGKAPMNGKGKGKAAILPEYANGRDRKGSRRAPSVRLSSPLAAEKRSRGRPPKPRVPQLVLPASSTPAPPSAAPSSAPVSVSPTTMIKKIRIKPLKTPQPTPDPDPEPIVPVRGSSVRHATPRHATPSTSAAPPAELPRNIIKLPAKTLTRELLKQAQAAERAQFGDVLTEEQANCDMTRMEWADKKRWEAARKKAEERMMSSVAATTGNGGSESAAPRLTRAESMVVLGGSRQGSPFTPLPGLRSTRSNMFLPQLSSFSSPAPGGADTPPLPASKPAPGSVHPNRRIKTLRFGKFDIDTWYDAPFPEEYANVPDGKMWICEFCLKYGKSAFGNLRHRMKCKARHPPGDEIYRAGNVSVFEVDGRKNKIYCQNLCLLAKMFLDHKTLFYDVEPFLFYVMTEMDDVGARFVGYFSKEKRCPSGYNVSCIMTLPAMQRRGWGNLLIGFSYLLSKKEGRVGTPERPLSGLGEVAYRNYWTLTINQFLDSISPEAYVRFEHISAATAMTVQDIVRTLTELNMLDVHDGGHSGSPAVNGRVVKKGRGRPPLNRGNSKKDEEPHIPITYSIHWDPEAVHAACEKWQNKGYLQLQPDKLKWSPFIMDRTKKTDTAGMGIGATNLDALMQPHINGNRLPVVGLPTEANGEEHADAGIVHTRPHTVNEAEQALETALEHAEHDLQVLETPNARRRSRPSRAVTNLTPRSDTGLTPSRRTRSAMGNLDPAEAVFEELPQPPQRDRKRKRVDPEPQVDRPLIPEPESRGEIVPDSTQPSPPRREPSSETEERPRQRSHSRPSPAKKRRIISPPESPELGVTEPAEPVAAMSPELGMETAPKSSPAKASSGSSADPLDVIDIPSPDPTPAPAPAPVSGGTSAPATRRGRGRPPGARNGSKNGTPVPSAPVSSGSRPTRSATRVRSSASQPKAAIRSKTHKESPLKQHVRTRSGRNTGGSSQRPITVSDDDDDEPMHDLVVVKPATRSSTKTSPVKPVAEVIDVDMEDAEGEDDEDMDAEGEPDPDV